MTNINKFGLAILSLVIVSGIYFLTKPGTLETIHSTTSGPSGLAGKIFLGDASDIQAKRIDNLSQLRDAYEQSMDENVRASLRSLILLEARDVENSKLPADLKKFIAEMRKEQQEAEQREQEQREQDQREQ
jgi:hypothetical protein